MRGNEHFVVAGNLGSSDIAVFQRQSSGKLELIETVKSSGLRPVSLDILGSRLFVLSQGNHENADIAANISILDLNPRSFGNILYSRDFQSKDEFVADIQVSPDGKLLSVSSALNRDRMSGFSLFRTYKIVGDVLEEINNSPFTTEIARQGFGFSWFSDSQRVVTSNPGRPSQTLLMSVDANDGSRVLSSVSGDFSFCWTTVLDDQFIHASGSGRIFTFSVNNNLEKLQTISARTASSERRANIRDMALSPNKQFLYAVDTAHQKIPGYRVLPDGTLEDLNITNLNITSHPFGMLTLK